MLTRAGMGQLIRHWEDFGLLTAWIFGGFDLVYGDRLLGDFLRDWTVFFLFLRDRLQCLVVVAFAVLQFIVLHDSQSVVEVRHFV